jgi:hypothetical protein
MSEPWYQTAAEQYLDSLEAALSSGPLSTRRLDRLFGDFLATVDAPAPEPALYPFFLNADVLRALTRELNFPFARPLLDRILQISPSPQRRRPSYRVRQLGLPGRYPNHDVQLRSAAYLVRNGPVLVTQNSQEEDELWGSGSELSDWTRHETRLATCLSCTEWGGFSLYLTREAREFPLPLIAHVDASLRMAFMLAYVSLCAGIRQHHRYGYWRGPHEVVGRYEYGDFRPHHRHARQFGARFRISHPLLLRTARHFLRGSMLWLTDAFTEDALANVMFALEGCLLLLQNRANLRTDRLDRRELRRIFGETFDHGEALYDFIDEAMGWGGTRARIVHPQLSLVEGWTPFLMADDYYDYHQIVRVLLTLVVTGRSFREYPLVSAA